MWHLHASMPSVFLHTCSKRVLSCCHIKSTWFFTSQSLKKKRRIKTKEVTPTKHKHNGKKKTTGATCLFSTWPWELPSSSNIQRKITSSLNKTLMVPTCWHILSHDDSRLSFFGNQKTLLKWLMKPNSSGTASPQARLSIGVFGG